MKTWYNHISVYRKIQQQQRQSQQQSYIYVYIHTYIYVCVIYKCNHKYSNTKVHPLHAHASFQPCFWARPLVR